MTPVPLNIHIDDFDHSLLFCADTDSLCVRPVFDTFHGLARISTSMPMPLQLDILPLHLSPL